TRGANRGPGTPLLLKCCRPVGTGRSRGWRWGQLVSVLCRRGLAGDRTFELHEQAGDAARVFWHPRRRILAASRREAWVVAPALWTPCDGWHWRHHVPGGLDCSSLRDHVAGPQRWPTVCRRFSRVGAVVCGDASARGSLGRKVRYHF